MYNDSRMDALMALVGGVICMMVLISVFLAVKHEFKETQYEFGRVTSAAQSCRSGGIFPGSCSYAVVVNAKGYRATFEQYAALPRGELACITVGGPFKGSVADSSRCEPTAAR